MVAAGRSIDPEGCTALPRNRAEPAQAAEQWLPDHTSAYCPGDLLHHELYSYGNSASYSGKHLPQT